jgi:hypothetical protein
LTRHVGRHDAKLEELLGGSSFPVELARRGDDTIPNPSPMAVDSMTDLEALAEAALAARYGLPTPPSTAVHELADLTPGRLEGATGTVLAGSITDGSITDGSITDGSITGSITDGAARSGPERTAVEDLGALGETAAIAAGVIAAAGRAAESAAALSDRLQDATQRLLGALGGGPPSEISRARSLSDSAADRLGDARHALLESTQALRAFVRERI